MGKYERTPKHEIERFTPSQQDRRQSRKTSLAYLRTQGTEERVGNTTPVALPMCFRGKLKVSNEAIQGCASLT